MLMREEEEDVKVRKVRMTLFRQTITTNAYEIHCCFAYVIRVLQKIFGEK